VLSENGFEISTHTPPAISPWVGPRGSESAPSLPVESVIRALRGYAEAGGAEELLAKYGLTPKDIEQAVRGVVRSKDS